MRGHNGKCGIRLVVRGRRRMAKGFLPEVEAHLSFLSRKGRKEALAHGVGGELRDDALGGSKLPLRETCICIL